MVLFSFLFASLIVDIAVSTVVSGNDGYEGAMIRAVRVIELHLIRLIMTILFEIWSNIRTTLMACTSDGAQCLVFCEQTGSEDERT